MTEVFISYSRRDKEFIRRLHEALLAQKRDVWVDWEDIPPTADWRAEIRSGIEATNAMIFVISPDSVRSKECRVELELALENNKRLIPLMYRMVTDPADQQGMHPSLNSHNWIMLRDEDPFEEGFQTVLKALDTDLAYVREHTRLLVRAREWEAEKRDASLLLRGSDLVEAESWLATGLEAKPAPTHLHNDYIRTSRQAEIARSRRLLVGVMAALLVSLVLGVFAFAQWQQSASNLALANTRGTEVAQQAATSESNALLAQNNAATADANALLAQNNEATAVYNEGRARSIALAGQTQLDVNNDDPERGLLLAIEALKNYPYSPQAEYALGMAVHNFKYSSVLPGTTTYQGGVYWSPDNQWLAEAAGEGLLIWDANTAEKVATLTGTITHAAWSPDAAYIATSDDSTHTVTVWDKNWRLQFQVEGTGAVWSPDSKRLVTRSANIVVWDGQTGQEIYRLKQAADYNTFYDPIAWSPDGSRLASGATDGIITVWNAEDGVKVAEWQGHDDIINILSWSPDGKQIVTGSGAIAVNELIDASARVWNAETGERLHALNVYKSPVISAAWSPDGNWIFVGSLEYVDIFNTQTWTANTYLAAFHPQWSSDSKYILTGSLMNNQAVIYDTAGQRISTLSGHEASVHTVAWSPDGVQVATASLDGTTRMWNISRDRTLLRFSDNYYYRPIWSPDGNKLWISNLTDDSIALWDVQTGTMLINRPANVFAIAPEDNPRYLRNSLEDDGSYQLSVINAQNEIVTTFSGHKAPFIGAQWSSDGREVVSSSGDNTVFVWNAETGQERLQLPGYDAKWSPDGSRLALVSIANGDGNQSVIIYDAQTGDQQQTLPVSPNKAGLTYVTQVDWSADGSRIATSTEQDIGAGNLIEIWDTSNGQHLYTLPGVRFSWSPDGNRIASVQIDGTIAVQNLTGEVVYSIVDPGQTLYDVVWSPNGLYIATTDRQDRISVWRAWQSTTDLIDFANTCCLTRQLTDEERAQFGLTAIGGS